MEAEQIQKIKYEENMSGWEKSLNDFGINTGCTIDEDRLCSITRLSESGLPTYKYYFFTISDFLSGAKSVMRADKLQDIVVRVCPKAGGLQRYTYIGKSLTHVNSELQKLKPNKDSYTIVINEYDPARYCGVILSEQDRLCIEMAEEPNLENLCHGRTTPWSAEFKDVFPYHFRRMEYKNAVPASARELMWNVVNSISKRQEQTENSSIFPHIQPRLGYFEFVISAKDSKLRFVDYKDSSI